MFLLVEILPRGERATLIVSVVRPQVPGPGSRWRWGSTPQCNRAAGGELELGEGFGLLELGFGLGDDEVGLGEEVEPGST